MPTGSLSRGSESRTRTTALAISGQPNSSLKLPFAASAILHQREPGGAKGRTRRTTTIPLTTRLVRTTPRTVPVATGDRASDHRQELLAVGSDVLTAKGYTVSYQECNDGHEYLCWRGAFADGLLNLAQ